MDNNQVLFQQRVGRIKSAIAFEPTDRVPVTPFFDGVVARFTGRSFRDVFYNHEEAAKATIDFLAKYPDVDAMGLLPIKSGIANELAGTIMMDWPGRPGTRVSDFSTHQIEEYEFMYQNEYPELLRDYTGFILRKYIPRAFTNIKGTEKINFGFPSATNTFMLGCFGLPEVQSALKLLTQISEEDAKARQVLMKYGRILVEMGYPSMIGGACHAPYDLLGDYFRGTVGMFEDITDENILPYVEETVDFFADLEIEALQYLRHVPMPLKLIFFPLHKGMDGFMDDKLYERLYWKPLKKIIMALLDMGDAIPYIYTEGPYNTRLEYLSDVPKGKVLVHFEQADMKRAKEIVGKNACISGNLSVSRMEFGTKQQIIDDTKRLLDICAPGGGYIFDFDGSLENAKEENLDAMFETLDKYGKY